MSEIPTAIKDAEELVRQALGLLMKAYAPTTESIYERAEFAVRNLISFLGNQADLMDLHPDLSLTLVSIGDHAGEAPLPPDLVESIKSERQIVPANGIIH